MALAFSELMRTVVGHKRLRIVAVTFDNSYPTNGEAIAPSDVDLQTIDHIMCEQPSGYQVQYDRTALKLVVRNPMPAHTHDLLLTGGQAAGDAVQVLATVVGKTGAGNVTAAGGASNVQSRAAAVGTEVANATDLSALVVVCHVYGI